MQLTRFMSQLNQWNSPKRPGGGGGENTVMSKVFRHKIASYTSKVVKSLQFYSQEQDPLFREQNKWFPQPVFRIRIWIRIRICFDVDLLDPVPYLKFGSDSDPDNQTFPAFQNGFCTYVGNRYCAADFSLLNLPKGKSLGRGKPAINS